jgi:hypothetical protein
MTPSFISINTRDLLIVMIDRYMLLIVEEGARTFHRYFPPNFGSFG